METKQKTSEQELEGILDDGDIGFFFEILCEEYQSQIMHLVNRASLYLLDAAGLQDEEVAEGDSSRSVFDWHTHVGYCPECQQADS